MAGITAATIASLAATAATTTASFVQASKQKKMLQKAEREAETSLEEAKQILDVNYYKGLSLQKEPYEKAREAILSQQAQALQAAQEAETRGLAATAGRTVMAGQEAQRGIAMAYGEKLSELEKLAAAEESRIAGAQGLISLEEVAGAQLAARDAEEARQLATQQAMAGVGSFIQQGAQLAPLYEKNAANRQLGRIERINERTGEYGSLQDIKDVLAQQGTLKGIDVSGVGGMSDLEFQDFIGQQSGDFGRAFRSDVLNLNAFNPFSIFKSQ